jgi:hypothetical protein
MVGQHRRPPASQEGLRDPMSSCKLVQSPTVRGHRVDVSACTRNDRVQIAVYGDAASSCGCDLSVGNLNVAATDVHEKTSLTIPLAN